MLCCGLVLARIFTCDFWNLVFSQTKSQHLLQKGELCSDWEGDGSFDLSVALDVNKFILQKLCLSRELKKLHFWCQVGASSVLG